MACSSNLPFNQISVMGKNKNYTLRPLLLYDLIFLLSLSTFSVTSIARAQGAAIPINVGIVLDLNTGFGKVGLSCINMSLSDFYSTHSDYKTRLVLHTRDSKGDVLLAAAAALDLIKNVEVLAIIGPQSTMQANFVLDIGDKAQVPIISFFATSPSLSPLHSPYFIRATHNDSLQVKAITALVKAFGWRQVVPIYIDNEYGNGIMPFLSDALQETDTRVPYRSVIPPYATDDQIVAELYKLMTMQTRVFIVHMLPSFGSRLFVKANEIGMMSKDYVWIMTDAITNLLSSMDPTSIHSMQGVLGIRSYFPRTKELRNFTRRWKRRFQEENPNIINQRLNIFGLLAYDTVTALAMAIEKAGAANSSNFLNTTTGRSSTDLDSFGVSQIGPRLQQALRSTNFKGLTGDFHIVDGQLESSTFEIINVIGYGGKRVGLWTLENGIIKGLNNSSNTNEQSTSKANLKAIIWPGDSTVLPKGWAIPTNGKKLRIGVPVRSAFNEFLKVKTDPISNTTVATGYCIDVFSAVLHTLPYSLSYEYIPFAKPDGTAAGDYNALIYQVFLQKFDAAVGDITIIANRSSYVDFTLPYTDSGVAMIVPIRDSRTKSPLVFLKPLSNNLWVTIFFFFSFIGFTIWVLEHRVNDHFRGSISNQVGLIFWYSFSTMVFAHGERVVSNSSRFVMIVWIFVVLILSSSYTASLTSMLTVEQLQPSITDMNELINKGQIVGYQTGSFVYDLLIKQGFDPKKLKPFQSPEDLDEDLSKGSRNGGVAAAIDEIPYMKLFLAKYGSKYTMVQPLYRTNGFGFAFPKGSPLVSDVSEAILVIKEGDKMLKIEKAWFGPQDYNYSDFTASISAESLGLDSFWCLFLIAGIASSLALLIFIVHFLYQHREDFLNKQNPKAPLLRILATRFNERDPSSHAFRNKQRETEGSSNPHGIHSQISLSTTSKHSNNPSLFSSEATTTSSGKSVLRRSESV